MRRCSSRAAGVAVRGSLTRLIVPAATDSGFRPWVVVPCHRIPDHFVSKGEDEG
jgi:hypothetical protein